MVHVVLYKSPALTAEKITELLALLVAAGIECDPELEIEDFEALLAADEPDEERESENPTEWVLVVLLTAECYADEGLSEAAAKVARLGGRVIGIWPPTGTQGRVPGAIERYGSDTIPWDAEAIRMAIFGESVSWSTPSGAPRAEPVTHRNKCG